MFLYQYICGKVASTQKNQEAKAIHTFPSIQLLPENKPKTCTICLKPCSNQTQNFCYLRSTDMTFSQNNSFIHNFCKYIQSEKRIASKQNDKKMSINKPFGLKSRKVTNIHLFNSIQIIEVLYPISILCTKLFYLIQRYNIWIRLYSKLFKKVVYIKR